VLILILNFLIIFYVSESVMKISVKRIYHILNIYPNSLLYFFIPDLVVVYKYDYLSYLLKPVDAK